MNGSAATSGADAWSGPMTAAASLGLVRIGADLDAPAAAHLLLAGAAGAGPERGRRACGGVSSGIGGVDHLINIGDRAGGSGPGPGGRGRILDLRQPGQEAENTQTGSLAGADSNGSIARTGAEREEVAPAMPPRPPGPRRS